MNMNSPDFSIVISNPHLDHSREHCGWVDQFGGVHFLDNPRETPDEFFIRAGHLSYAVKKAESGYAGVWHSHPPPLSPEPSTADLDGLPSGQRGWVVHIESGLVTEYVRGQVVRSYLNY